MRDCVTYPILRCILGYIDDQQLHYDFHIMTLGSQVCLLISWHEHVQHCYEVHAYVT